MVPGDRSRGAAHGGAAITLTSSKPVPEFVPVLSRTTEDKLMRESTLLRGAVVCEHKLSRSRGTDEWPDIPDSRLSFCAGTFTEFDGLTSRSSTTER